MVQFEELLLKLQALKPEIDDLSDALGMKGMLSEIQQLELKATEPGFWDDPEKSQPVSVTCSQIRRLKGLCAEPS